MRITIEEIARMAGVSKATVSRVLNNSPTGVGSETRARVQKLAERLNYSINSTEIKGEKSQTKSIALILPDIINPFFAEIAKAIEIRAEREGYFVIIVNTDFSEERESECIRNIIARKIDGVLLIPSGSTALPEHLLPKKYGVPLVLLDRRLKGLNECFGIYSDNEYASFQSCEKFIKHGSDRIAFISGGFDISTSEERLKGYRVALEQYRIEFDPTLLVKGSYTVESGYNAVLHLERSGVKYSAVLAANDLIALGALKALKELRYKVPLEVELIGFDNIEFSQYCDPPLSTVQQPTLEMGEKATELLFKLIAGQSDVKSERLAPRLLMRKTTR